MPIRIDEADAARELRRAAEEAFNTRAFVDVRTLCLVTGQAERIIRQAITNGDIPSLRIGRSIRIPTAPLRRAWGLDG